MSYYDIFDECKYMFLKSFYHNLPFAGKNFAFFI